MENSSRAPRERASERARRPNGVHSFCTLVRARVLRTICLSLLSLSRSLLIPLFLMVGIMDRFTFLFVSLSLFALLRRVRTSLNRVEMHARSF